VSGQGIVFVPVDALDQDRPAVEEELPALDLDLAEAEPGALNLNQPAGIILQREDDGVEIGMFGRPFRGVLKGRAQQKKALGARRDIRT
jgi:hypothetical protein